MVLIYNICIYITVTAILVFIISIFISVVIYSYFGATPKNDLGRYLKRFVSDSEKNKHSLMPTISNKNRYIKMLNNVNKINNIAKKTGEIGILLIVILSLIRSCF
jgi:hypothetical protein